MKGRENKKNRIMSKVQEIDTIEIINNGAVNLRCKVKREFVRTTVGELMGYEVFGKGQKVAFNYNENTKKATTKFLGKEVIINPDHQRGYVWKDWVKNGLIGSVILNRDINTITLVQYTDGNGVVSNDNVFEVLNGQQRLVTIGKFLTGNLSFMIKGMSTPVHWDILKGMNDGLYNRQFLECPVSVIILRGERDDIMEEWKVVNIPAEKHTNQEIRNGCYNGTFNNKMRAQFAAGDGHFYMEKMGCGDVARQGQTETAYCWLSCDVERNKNEQDILIDKFMVEHMGYTSDEDFMKEMKKIRDISNWWQKWTKPLASKCYDSVRGLGRKIAVLYNLYKDIEIPAAEVIKNFVDKKLVELGETKKGNLDVTAAKDIMEELISGDKVKKTTEFSNDVKTSVYTMNKGICGRCGKPVPFEEAHFHHLIPQCNPNSNGSAENCVLLHANCHNHATTTENLADPATFPYAVNINR